MKRMLGLLGALGLAAVAAAFLTFEKPFYAHYGVKDGSKIDNMKCLPCHEKITGGKLNPYGLDMQAEMKKQSTKRLTPSVLNAIDKMDSDKDGMANGEEVRKDRNPGAKS